MLEWLRTHPLRRTLPLVFLLAVTGSIGAGAYWLAVHLEKNDRNPLPASIAPTAAQIAIDARQADEMVQRIVALEATAEADAAAKNPEAALGKMREALQLQHDLNVSQTDPHHKSVVREARLNQRVEALAIEPLRLATAQALTEARAAASDRHWDRARQAYAKARMLQEQLSRAHTGSSYADAAVLKGIEEEIATLNTSDRASAAVEGGRHGD
jgi:hypothetical protein